MTNVGLIGLYSTQFDACLSVFGLSESIPSQHIKLMAFIAVEHLLIGIKLLIFCQFPKVPPAVADELRRAATKQLERKRAASNQEICKKFQRASSISNEKRQQSPPKCPGSPADDIWE